MNCKYDNLLTSYCGTKTVTFYDEFTNENLGSLITYDDSTSKITISPEVVKAKDIISINFVLGLVNYPTITY